jgi:signal transduction histidine kinase
VPREEAILLSALPPTKVQVRAALLIALALFVAFLITLVFMDVQLPPLNAFIPVVDTILFLNDLITAVLLYAQFSVSRTRALLALAMGYLFNAVIIVPHALTFPGAFTPTGLLGAGLQTTVWLYIFWHLGLPPAVITYAILKREHRRPAATAHRPARSAIVTSAAAVVLLAATLTWLVTTGAGVMPAIMVDAMHASSVWHDFAAPPILALSVASVALLWWRRSSMLDLWLLLVLWAWLIETILLSTTASRFSLVWYAGRAYGLVSSSFVLLVLLSETTMLYARLALSVVALRREREARLMTLDAMSAAISHEIKQPLGAIVTNSIAGLRWLNRSPPSLDNARDTFGQIAVAGRRANDVIQSVREMFKESDQEGTPLNTNELIQEVIANVRDELEAARIVIRLELAAQLPTISAHKGQLQQVMLNVIANAADAMRSVTDRARVLKVTSEVVGPSGIAVSIEDSGTGVEPQNHNRIFDAFYTTKSRGMGMGLAICRSIVEAHGGTLSVSPGAPHGSVFRVALPAQQTSLRRP